MSEHICKKCGKVYNIFNRESDADFCSFDCWEKVNCLEPSHDSVPEGDLINILDFK